MTLLNTRISRRLVVVAAAASAVPVRAATKAQPRAVALIGDRAHNSNYIQMSLDRVFHALNIPIDYTIDYAALSAASLKPYQLLLIFRDGENPVAGSSGADFYADYERNLENADDFPGVKPVPWMSEEQGLAIKSFVTDGGGFYALHDASHISLSCKNYRDVMGGAFVGHPPLRPFEVHATANAHPITAGMETFVVSDEQHFVDYDKDPHYIILESENRDGLTFQNRGTRAPSG